MSILFEKYTENFSLLVYKIENENQFYHQGINYTDFDRQEYERISNEVRRRQWLASRYWVKQLSKQHETLILEKTELGKPLIKNFPLHFSISHSRDMVAVITSEVREVAVDIEVIQEKILSLKKKFLHPLDYEHRDRLESLTMIWSAKESIYKYHHDKSLYSFKEQIAITSSNSKIMTYSFPSNIQLSVNKVHYQIIEDTVLTWIE